MSALRARLATCGYAEHAIRDRLGIRHPDDVGPINRPAILEKLRAASDTLSVLLRLWFLEVPVRERDLAGALPSRVIELAVRLGLLRRRGPNVVARLRLDAAQDGLFFADRRFADPDRNAAGLPRGDMVYPVCSDSVMLADVVEVPRGARVLDLCTGSGVQGILAAKRAASVTCVDIGRRAVAMARLNASFYAIDNLKVELGDLYRPVEAGRFDVIVANPPFVPAPDRGPAYHSGGPLGDRVLKRIVEGFAGHLAEGGRAFAISHLALKRGQTLEAAINPWLVGFDGRAMALTLEIGTPIDLAAAQAQFALDEGFAAYEREVSRWVRFLARHDVEQVVALILVAQRTGRPGFEVVDGQQRSLTLPVSAPPAQLVARWLSA